MSLDTILIGITNELLTTGRGVAVYAASEVHRAWPVHPHSVWPFGMPNPLAAVCVLLDSDDWREAAQLELILDTLINQKRMTSAIAVFVPAVSRGLEYGGYSKFREFISNELVPKINSKFKTSNNPNDRAVLGSSRGGLAARDLGLKHSDQFGYVAAIAPAIRPLPFFKELETAERKPFRVGIIECCF